MKTLEIKSRNEKSFFIKLFAKIQEGWEVTKNPKKNWLGEWTAELEEKKLEKKQTEI